MATSFLEIRNLHAWYGESHVLHGVNFNVNEGEVVTRSLLRRINVLRRLSIKTKIALSSVVLTLLFISCLVAPHGVAAPGSGSGLA